MKILTQKELMKALQISQPTVIDWAKKGMPVLRSGKTVRYVLEEVIAWMAENQKKSIQNQEASNEA